MLPLTPPERTILHLDLDAFFAAVEQRDDPRLRGRPVAVGAGVVASCSYEARAYGVRTGMALRAARQLCPALVVLPGTYAKYAQVGRQLRSICQERCPVVEAAALDDLYLDLTHVGGCRPEQVAADLRAQVRDELRLSASVGVGGSKLIAAIATKQAKPGRQVLVPRGGERAFLAPKPVRVLPGAGRVAAAKLERVNVRAVGQLADMPRPLVRGLLGPRGRQLHEYAQGLDWRPVVADRRPQSVSRSTSLEPASADPAFLRALLGYLVERAAGWLRYHDLAADRLTVTLRYNDFQSATGQTRLPGPAQRDEAFRAAAVERLFRLYVRRLPLRFVGVCLHGLTPADHQPELFPEPGQARRDRLTACQDAIRARFGFLALTSGTTLALTQTLPHDREQLRLRTACLTR